MTELTGSGEIAVVGAGGHAKVVASVLQAAGYRVAGLFDDSEELWGMRVLGAEVQGGLADLGGSGLERGFLGLGDNRLRSELSEKLALSWATAVHPRAWLHETVVIGEGTLVCAGAVVQPDVRAGRHAIVNTGARIDHDCHIGDYVHVAPGSTLTGSIKVGTGAFLGAGCTVVRGVTIGEWATVGAGATVIRDVEPGTTVKGVPAR